MFRRRLLGAIASVLIAPVCVVAQDGPLRAGIYENLPKIGTDEDGAPTGLFVDVLNSLADDIGRTIEWVPCEWPICLDLLEDGTIDVMPDVAWAADRAERFEFGREPVLYSWSDFFGRSRDGVDSLSELAGLRISVLDGSVQMDRLRDYFDQLGIDGEIVVRDSFETVMAAAADGEADAAFVNIYLGTTQATDLGLRPSGRRVALSPLHFAFARDVPADVILDIDIALFQQQTQAGSDYHLAYGKWIAPVLGGGGLPAWAPWAFAALGAALLGSAVLAWLFRRQVRLGAEALAEMRAKALTAHQATTMGTLALGFAHDFGNTLTIVRGALIELRSRFAYAMTGDTLQTLKDAENATATGIATTRRLGALAAHGTADLQRVDLSRQLVEMTPLLRRSVPTRIDLRIGSNQAVRPVLSDSERLQNAILNLVLNAVDAMPEGGHLTLAVENGPDGGPMFICRDTGKGMSGSTLSRAKEPFYTTKDSGSGLGLAAVDSFMRAQGGELVLESVEGDGTTVVLRFPTDDPSPDANPLLAASFGGGRVLLVEDNETVRRTIGRQLRTLSFDVVEVPSADAALAFIAGAEGVDAVVADCALPGILQGQDLVRALRDLAPSLHVVLITADPAMRAPADVRLLSKPVTLAGLAEALDPVSDRMSEVAPPSMAEIRH